MPLHNECRYLISSLEAGVEKILRASRQHWQIENGLHGGLDVAFKADHSQVRTNNAAENLALVRRLVTSVIKQDETIDAGTQNKRMRAAWDDGEHFLRKLKDAIALSNTQSYRISEFEAKGGSPASDLLVLPGKSG